MSCHYCKTDFFSVIDTNIICELEYPFQKKPKKKKNKFLKYFPFLKLIIAQYMEIHHRWLILHRQKKKVQCCKGELKSIIQISCERKAAFLVL